MIWKFPLIFVIFEMFLFVEESDLSSFLLSVTAFQMPFPDYRVSSSVRTVLFASGLPLSVVFMWVSLPESLKSVMKD